MSEFLPHLERLQAAVAGSEADALLITSPENRFWATGFPSSAGIALVAPGEALFATDFRYLEDAGGRIRGFAVEESDGKRDYGQIIRDWTTRLGVKTLGFEGSIPYDDYRRYLKPLELEIRESGALLADLRRVKDGFELRRIAAAQEIAAAAFEDILPLIREGVEEAELARELDYAMRRRGAAGSSFATIAVSGENGSHCHGTPSGRRVRRGEFITLDFGCVAEGYCSDMTRTVAVGQPDGAMREVYELVLEAQTAALAAARPGVIGRELDAVARDIITAGGYGAFFGHGLGHGVGIAVHDGDGPSPRNNHPLPEGAVVSIEPGIYLPGRFGVRIEDVVSLQGDGCVNLVRSPKELLIL